VETLAKLLDDLPQVVCVLLDNAASLLLEAVLSPTRCSAAPITIIRFSAVDS
jgi:hypothetical protein